MLENFTSLSTLLYINIFNRITHCEVVSLSPCRGWTMLPSTSAIGLYDWRIRHGGNHSALSNATVSVLCPWVRDGHYAHWSGVANLLTLDLGLVPRGWTRRGYTVDGPGNRISSLCSALVAEKKLSQIRGRGRAAPLPDLREIMHFLWWCSGALLRLGEKKWLLDNGHWR